MRRYYQSARAILEYQGGTVEKFVGDAVMAVFGIPVATEDDALRAVRAAVELRDTVQDLCLEARIGANPGDVGAVVGLSLDWRGPGSRKCDSFPNHRQPMWRSFPHNQ